MKQIKILLGLILLASVTTFAQSPRIKLNQITKDTVKGSVLISSPSDSGMVYSRDLFISYGADTVLILGGDTLAATSGIISSVLSDGVTITGDGTLGSELTADTSVLATLRALSDSLALVISSVAADNVTITGDGTVGSPLKVDTATVVATKGDLSDYVTVAETQTITGAKTFSTDVEIDGKLDLNDGSDRVFVGTSAGTSNTGTRSNGFGYEALLSNSGSNSNGFGYYALRSNSGTASNGFGREALRNNSGTESSGLGLYALYNNTGNNSNGFGNQALFNNTGANSNGFGFYALRENSGANSSGFGYQALFNNTGNSSNGFGFYALRENSGANSNGLGSYALLNNTGANSNGFGYQALLNNTGTTSNGFGNQALSNNKASDNTAIGHQAGYETLDLTGGSNTFLGYNASYGANTTITNATAVGANVTLSNSNTVILGNGANVGIGTDNPNYDLEVVGKIYASDSIISNVYAGTSDIRLKQDIEPTDKGLDAVMELNPVSYRFIANADSEKKSYGFIAQEIEEVIPDVVGTRHDGMKVLNYNDLISVLTKAIQEQQIIIEELNQRLIKLENK
jgi:hypothetical protein